MCFKRIFDSIKNIRSSNVFFVKKNNFVQLPKHCHIKFNVHGKNNKVIIKDNVVVKKGIINIFGNDNSLFIGDNNLFNDVDLWIEDNNSNIEIGNNNVFSGSIQIACLEGKRVKVGDECLFSSNIMIANGDSHSILNSNGERINPSNDLIIGSHVWVGKNVSILKSGSIGNGVVVGSDSVVTKDFSLLNNAIIAGNPAKIIKQNINWISKRI